MIFAVGRSPLPLRPLLQGLRRRQNSRCCEHSSHCSHPSHPCFPPWCHDHSHLCCRFLSCQLDLEWTTRAAPGHASPRHTVTTSPTQSCTPHATTVWCKFPPNGSIGVRCCRQCTRSNNENPIHEHRCAPTRTKPHDDVERPRQFVLRRHVCRCCNGRHRCLRRA